MRLPLASIDAPLPASYQFAIKMRQIGRDGQPYNGSTDVALAVPANSAHLENELVSERARWPAVHPLAEMRRLYGIEVACCPVPKDRAGQSAAVRACAAALLDAHGVESASIGRLPSGAPHWPSGWVGSFSHAQGGGAVAVARSSFVETVGIDFEYPKRMHRALWPHVLSAPELKALAGVPEAAANQRAAAVFSAKEAIYKALAPLGGPVPGFHEVEICWRSDGAFRAQQFTPPDRAGCTADTSPVDLDLSGLLCPVAGHVLALVWRPSRVTKPQQT